MINQKSICLTFDESRTKIRRKILAKFALICSILLHLDTFAALSSSMMIIQSSSFIFTRDESVPSRRWWSDSKERWSCHLLNHLSSLDAIWCAKKDLFVEQKKKQDEGRRRRWWWFLLGKTFSFILMLPFWSCSAFDRNKCLYIKLTSFICASQIESIFVGNISKADKLHDLHHDLRLI